MSLINDMLRDLDARRSQPVGDRMTALPCTGTGGVENAITRPGIAWVMTGICLMSAIAIGAPSVKDYLAGTETEGPGTPVAMVENNIPVVLDEPVRMAGTIADPAPATETVSMDTERDRHPRTRNDAETPDIPVTTESQNNTESSEQPHGGITLHASTPAQQFARAYRQAAMTAAAGNYRDATNQLENILVRNNSGHEARLLLANLYIRQGRSASAESLLAGGLASHPLHAPYARLLAHLLLPEKRYREAIDYLQSALPGATRDAEYHALLAALYQRSGEPAVAARHYSIALDISPGRGEWWMGLGISQEQAGQGDVAHTAYRKALQFPLAAALQEYINNRLHRLADDVSLDGLSRQLPGKG